MSTIQSISVSHKKHYNFNGNKDVCLLVLILSNNFSESTTLVEMRDGRLFIHTLCNETLVTMQAHPPKVVSLKRFTGLSAKL